MTQQFCAGPITYCVDGLPSITTKYDTSLDVLIYTIWNTYTVAHFRRTFDGIGYFYVGSACPIAIKNVVFWAELRVGSELYGER